jgi:multidrug transporter EmrE-like cation transporter
MLVVYRQGERLVLQFLGAIKYNRVQKGEMVRWDVLGYGTLLALVDVVMMPIAKGVSKKVLPLWMMIIPTLIYAADPWIFLQSLKVETMVVMNLVWDLLSDILVTFTGLVLLGEKVSTMKSIGIGLSFVSLYFLSHESV